MATLVQSEKQTIKQKQIKNQRENRNRKKNYYMDTSSDKVAKLLAKSYGHGSEKEATR